MLPPQTAVNCRSWAVSGRFDGEYTGEVKATLADKSEYKYKNSGSVHSEGWAKAGSQCTEMELSAIPEAVPNGIDLKDTKRAVGTRVRGLGWFYQGTTVRSLE